MIYFVQEQGTGYIKIGYAKNDVESRISGLQTGCPHLLKLLLLKEGNRANEGEIHKQFKHLHFRGEWFFPAQELLDYLAKQEHISSSVPIIQLSPTDKRIAVEKALLDNPNACDRAIARICKVSAPTVSIVRKHLGAGGGTLRISSNGKRMETRNIGRKKVAS